MDPMRHIFGQISPKLRHNFLGTDEFPAGSSSGLLQGALVPCYTVLFFTLHVKGALFFFEKS